MIRQTHNNLLQGFRYLLDGFRLIFKPGLKRFLIIPLLINALIYIGIFLLSQHYLNSFNHWIDHYLPHWLRWVHTVVWLVFMAGYMIILIYTFITLSNTICLPFNSLLSEKVQIYLTGKAPIQKTSWEYIKDLPHLLYRQLSMIGYFLPRAFFLLILFWMPVVQVVAALLWVVFNAWMMTIQHIDYPMDNNHITFSELRHQLTRNCWASLGFGLSVLALSLFPIVNFILVPAAVAGATAFWVKEYSEHTQESQT